MTIAHLAIYDDDMADFLQRRMKCNLIRIWEADFGEWAYVLVGDTPIIDQARALTAVYISAQWPDDDEVTGLACNARSPTH